MWQVANLKALPHFTLKPLSPAAQALVDGSKATMQKATQEMMEWQRLRWISVYVKIVAPVIGYEFARTCLRHPDRAQVEKRLLAVINARRIAIDIHDGKVVVTEFGTIVHTYKGKLT